MLSSGLSIFGGVSLANGKRWEVVPRAIICLWVAGPMTALVLVVPVAAMILGNTLIDDGAIREIFGSVLSAGFWTAYLLMSSRVKATYASEPATSADSEPVMSKPGVPAHIPQAPALIPPTSAIPSSLGCNPRMNDRAPIPVDSSEEEDMYAAAFGEIQAGTTRPGLWAKALAETDGDEGKCKALYIRLRVHQIKEEVRRLQDQAKEAAVSVSQKRDQAFESLVAALAATGYRARKGDSGWTVHEPLGGREKLKNDDALIEYASGKISIPEELRVFVEPKANLDPPEVICGKFLRSVLVSAAEVRVLVDMAESNLQLVSHASRINGNTLLHLCAQFGLEYSAGKLVALGARLDAPNGNGRKPAELANTDSLRHLLTRGPLRYDLK